MTFTSEIIRCNVPNKNGHVYTKECIVKALEKPAIKRQIENGRFFGGFMEFTNTSGEINLSNVSHVCKKLWWEDDTLYGKFETLDTPKGQALEKSLHRCIKENCMATSGLGTLEIDADGNQIVKDYTLLSIDFTEEKAR